VGTAGRREAKNGSQGKKKVLLEGVELDKLGQYMDRMAVSL
jgi:hypothetical protein